MKIAEWIKYSCQNNYQKSKRASLPSHINWAKDNEKACDRTIMKSAKIINKIMLIWIFNWLIKRQWRCKIQSATWCFSREKNILFKQVSMWWFPARIIKNIVS